MPSQRHVWEVRAGHVWGSALFLLQIQRMSPPPAQEDEVPFLQCTEGV